MRKAIELMVIAMITMTFFAVPTSAKSESFLDKIFNKNDSTPQEPPPEVTLKAPFADKPTTAPPSNKLMSIYEANDQGNTTKNEIDMSQPHRNEAQIVGWCTEIVTQAMTVKPQTYDKDFQKISEYFLPYAKKEYQDYFQKSNILNILNSNEMRLQSISDEEGSVIKEGSISGTYHWLVQIPLMTSFYKADQDSVDKNANIQSQDLIVQVQVGRIHPKSSADIGLVIERWSVSTDTAKR